MSVTTFRLPCLHLLRCENLLIHSVRFVWQFSVLRNSNDFIQGNTLEHVVCEMAAILSSPQCVNTSRSRQNDQLFAEGILKLDFLQENCFILIEISLTFAPKGQINDIPELVLMIASGRTGETQLSESMMTLFTVAYVRHSVLINQSCQRSLWYSLLIPNISALI